ncbi:MAG: hypothetical protein CR955_00380 [Thiotrichales bacterium]|nr:MAG: hypothetical protein CR955_00380 [Thiotrichales bacterium]
MSDNCLHIVPKHRDDYPDSELKAKEILTWFQEREMVEDCLSNCILSTNQKGYRFKLNITSIFNDGTSWVHNDALLTQGLELAYGKRKVFHPVEGAYLTITCPSCGKAVDEETAYHWIDDWHENKGKDYQNCPSCNEKRHLTEYEIEPAWAFSNLGISLWNTPWDLTTEFLSDMKKLFKTEIIVVPVRI